MPKITLKDFIQKKIQESGPISFSEFMEMALYHPELGYYSKPRQDDYYTSVDVGAPYARVLARYFHKLWFENFFEEPQFKFIELGAGSGKFAGQVLSFISEEFPKFYEKLHYVCIERSPARQLSIRNLKSRFPGRLEVFPEFEFEDRSVDGIFFSNEFFDALPFQRVVKKNGRIQEIFVEKTFREILSDPKPQTKVYFDWLGKEPLDGAAGEAHFLCWSWMGKLAQALRKGLLFTFDYGYESEELYSEIRSEGTAICHFRHQTSRKFYENIGEQDITAHVNFSALIQAGQECGVQSHELKTQSEFFIQDCAGEMQKEREAALALDPKKKLRHAAAIQSLIHPEGMGGTFRVLLQKKSLT